MTNQPGLRMVLEKLKQQFEAFLKMFNVSLGGDQVQQRQPYAAGNAGSLTNPTEVPLQIGNELLITDEIVKMYHGLLNARGRVVIIDQMPAKEGMPVKASAFGIQVDVGMQEARHMRDAYIFREQA